MPLRSRLYNVLFRRTSTFALTIVLGALVFERAFDQGADAFYERLNHGRGWLPAPHRLRAPA
uniref:Complex III subunit 9 n=1 Tax=Terrapene triunguis TaxID=2587831 RepID=A0A674IF17_9SAUR